MARSTAILLLAAALLGACGGPGGAHHIKRLIPAAGNGPTSYDPFAYVPARRAQFEQRAAAGLAHVLYALSPGGALATARRVNRLRALIERSAAKAPGAVDADTLEAIVFLESAGRPDAIAGGDVAGAAGLTQIVAQTGQSLLGLHIDLRVSRRLTRRIARGGPKTAARRRARARADERFVPHKALAATVRYLSFARAQLHRDDLAVESYHMGVGNLQRALGAYGEGDIPYAQLFFDSSPLRHAGAWGVIGSLGDDSATYLWRVRAAAEIMRLYRTDRQRLAAIQALQTEKASAEDLLRPPATTPRFAGPQALADAEAAGTVQTLSPRLLRTRGLIIDRGMGSLARRLGAKPALYRGLRPEALALLVYIGTGVQAISHTAPLTVTSTVRDLRYQRLLAATDLEATRAFSQHTAGFAFDVSRRYRSHAQALAFQFMLDRLQALDVAAWVREPSAIHATAGPAARALLPIIGLRP